MSRRQPADPSADHHQIVRFSSLGRRSRGIPALTIAKLMCVGERAVVIAAYPCQRRRIVASGLLRSSFLRDQGRKRRISNQQPARADRHAIQKIPPRNRAMHAQLTLFLLLTHAKNSLPQLLFTRAKTTAY